MSTSQNNTAIHDLSTISLLEAINDCKHSEDITNELKNKYPFAEEILNGTFLNKPKPREQLIESLEAFAYYNVSSKEVIREIIWSSGNCDVHFDELFIKNDKFVKMDRYPQYKEIGRRETYRVRDDIQNTFLLSELKIHYPDNYIKEELDCRFKGYLTNDIAFANNFRLLKRAYEDGSDWGSFTCAFAALNNNFEMLKWLIDVGCPCRYEVFHSIAKIGNLEMFKWAIEKGIYCDKLNKLICRSAAEYGHFELLKYACNEVGFILCNNVAYDSVKSGNFEMLQWAIENGCKVRDDITKKAAEYGHFEILKWAVANGIKIHIGATILAAYNGHFEIVKWLIANGCNWDQYIIIHSIISGHLNILKWAIENGCPYKNSYYNLQKIATENNQMEILEWLRANNY